MENLNELMTKLETLITENNLPRADEALMREIKIYCHKIAQHSPSAASKAGKLAKQAETFYSERKHAKYAGGSDTLHSDIMGTLRALKEIVK